MFVHLRLHTEFSVVDGTNRIDEVAKAAAKDGQPALAITDLNNLFGAIKFYKEARGQGVKPLIGAEIVVEGLGKDAGVLSRMILLVQGPQGYLNLCELLARAWTRNVVKAQAVVRLEWLKELSEGLILLSGAQAGPVGQALVQGDSARAADLALQLASIFPHRFYLELQRAGRAEDGVQVAGAVQLAARLNLPVVATHPVQFHARDDSRPTKPGSALPKARSWPTRGARADSRPNSISRAAPRCRRCSPTCPARWPTPWRLPAAAA